MLIKEFTLTNQGGLHARPAMFLVELCKTFQSTIKVALENKQADAKSLVSLMILGAGAGKTIALSVEGSDEQQAMEKITEYFTNLPN